MGIFGNSRKKIEKWAPLVMEGYVPGMPVEEKFLDTATMLYIQQHARILYDSMSRLQRSQVISCYIVAIRLYFSMTLIHGHIRQ